MKLSFDIAMAFNGLLVIVISYAAWQFKRLIQTVHQIEKDVEVMKVRVSEALNLRSEVKENGSNLIRLDERMAKCNKDLDALHEAKRKIMEQISQH